LRIGTNVWAGYEPLYLARSLNYLPPGSVKLVEYVSNTQSMRGLTDGIIEGAALTLDEALLLQQQGVDIRIVLVMDYSAGADAILAHPNISSLHDLRGKRIGVETSALGAYMMSRILAKSGLTTKDVDIISLELSQHEQSYLSDTIDAVVTFDPVKSRLLEHGAKVLLDTSELPGEVVDVLVVRSDVMIQHRDNIQTLLGAWFRSVSYIEKYPDDAARQMTGRMKLNEADVLNALRGIKLPDRTENRKLLLENPAPLLKQAERLSKIMEENHLLHGPTQTSTLFDKNLLRDLLL
jgi:NitT/TauT family transport system substrate-binding protein